MGVASDPKEFPNLQKNNAAVVEEFRANAGRVRESFSRGEVLLLTTTGAKSGQPRTVPLTYLQDADDVYVIGSFGGLPAHPAWYRNLVANPVVRVELGDQSYLADAETVTGDLHDRIWVKLVAVAPRYAEYQRNAAGHRTIPLVRLRRRSAE